MEVLFRKYFWTVNLVFLALLAFLSAKTVNVFTESAISPPPDFTPVVNHPPHDLDPPHPPQRRRPLQGHRHREAGGRGCRARRREAR